MRTVIDLHDGTGFSNLPKRVASDPFWWGVTGLLCVAALALPNYLGMSSDPEGRRLVVESALFLSGALVGCLRPRRPWRWAIAAFVAIVIQDLPLASNWIVHADLPRLEEYLSANVQVYLIETIPVFVGAALGSWAAQIAL